MLRNVRKHPFHPPEVEGAADEQQQGDRPAGGNVDPGQGLGAQQCGAEALDDADHGVEAVGEPPGFGDVGRRVDHGGGVHQQLDDKADGVFDVAVLDGHGREDHAQSQGGQQQDQDQQGQGQDAPRRRKAEPDHEPGHDDHADDEIQQFGQGGRQRQDQSREIDLADHIGILDQAVGRLGQRIGKVIPGHHGGKAEDDVGYPVGADARQVAEHNGKDQRGEQRLDNGPTHAQHRLRIPGLDAADGQEIQEVPVAVQLPPVDHFPPGGGFYDGPVGQVGRLKVKGATFRCRLSCQRDLLRCH